MKWGRRAAGAGLVAAGLAISAPLAAAGGARPEIVKVSVSAISQRGATLEAMINPEGAKTKYHFELSWELVGEPGTETGGKGRLESRSAGGGRLRAAYEGVAVRSVRRLHADTYYRLAVEATNALGEVTSEEVSFETR